MIGENETRQLKNKLMEKNGYKSGKSFKRVMKEAKRLQRFESMVQENNKFWNEKLALKEVKISGEIT